MADLLLLRVPQQQIAERLGTSASTISRDARAIMSAWDDQLREAGNRLRAREAFELDQMEAECVLHEAEALRLADEVVPVLRKDMPLQEQATREPVKRSSAWERYRRDAREWTEKRLRIKERRAKLMNIDLEIPQTNINVAQPIMFIERGPVVGRELLESDQIESGDVIEGDFTPTDRHDDVIEQ